MHFLSVTLAVVLAFPPRPSAPQAPELEAPGDLVAALVSPDGERILTWSAEIAWLHESGQGLPLLAIQAEEHRFDPNWAGGHFSRDGERAVLWGRRGMVARIDIPRTQVVIAGPTLPPGSWARGAVDERARVLALHANGRLHLFALDDQARELGSFASRARGSFALSESGKLAVVQTREGVRRIDIGVAGATLAELIAPGRWDDVVLSADASSALLVKASELRAVELPGGRVKASLALGRGPWRLVASHPLAHAAFLVGRGSELRAYDASDLTLLWSAGETWSAQVEPRSRTVWTWTRPEGCIVRDLRSGVPLWSPEPELSRRHGPVESTHEGHVLVPVRHRGLVRRSARDGARMDDLLPWRVDGHRIGIFPSGPVWFVGHDGRVRSVGVEDGRLLATREIPGRPRAASAMGTRLVVTSTNGLAAVFAGPALEPQGSFLAGSELVLAPQGDRLLAYGTGSAGLRVHALPRGELLRELGGDAGHFGQAAWDDTGEVIAALDEKGQPWLWRGEQRIGLRSTAERSSLAVDPRGRWLVLGDEEPRVLVLATENGAEIASLGLRGEFGFGVRTKRLRFDRRGNHVFATTGDFGTVQAWHTADMKSAWDHDTGCRNAGVLEMHVDDASDRLWVWGMSDRTPAALGLRDGRVVRDLAGRDLWELAPDGERVAALERGSLVLLEPDGNVRWRRVEVSDLGGVVARADGGLSGDEAAMRHVFVLTPSGLTRADEHALRDEHRQR